MEPVNFLQSTALKINQEYVRHDQKQVMDVQESQPYNNLQNVNYSCGKYLDKAVKSGNEVESECGTVQTEEIDKTLSSDNEDVNMEEVGLGIDIEKTENVNQDINMLNAVEGESDAECVEIVNEDDVRSQQENGLEVENTEEMDEIVEENIENEDQVVIDSEKVPEEVCDDINDKSTNNIKVEEVVNDASQEVEVVFDGGGENCEIIAISEETTVNGYNDDSCSSEVYLAESKESAAVEKENSSQFDGNQHVQDEEREETKSGANIEEPEESCELQSEAIEEIEDISEYGENVTENIEIFEELESNQERQFEIKVNLDECSNLSMDAPQVEENLPELFNQEEVLEENEENQQQSIVIEENNDEIIDLQLEEDHENKEMDESTLNEQKIGALSSKAEENLKCQEENEEIEELDSVQKESLSTFDVNEKQKSQNYSPKLPVSTKSKKPSIRLQMAQLIERKLQSTEETPVVNGFVQSEDSAESEQSSCCERENEQIQEVDPDYIVPDNLDEQEKEEKPKKPIIGSVRKSERRTERLTKPPWLLENEETRESFTENHEDDENYDVEELEEDETGDNNEGNQEVLDEGTEGQESEITENGIDMREKLTSQLQMLKVKKSGSLFDAKIPDLTKLQIPQFKRRKVGALSEVATSTPSPLGLKIVAVAGGVDLENFQKVPDIQLQQPDDTKEVIINDHLDLPTIKLTKTKDYKKIKGWSKKKLLALDDSSEGIDSASVDTFDEIDIKQEIEDNPLPSCSYLVKTEPGIDDDNNEVVSDIKVESPDIQEQESTNIFASNSLDGFLEEKDLNISYNVPKLKSSNHDINLLNAELLVDIDEDKKRKLDAETAAVDSSNNSSNNLTLKDDKNLYKPRTLAEKRKMLSDELDGIEPRKKIKSDKSKQKKFSRRPISSRFEANSPLKEMKSSISLTELRKTSTNNDEIQDLTLDDDHFESLLVPMNSKAKQEKPKENKENDCVFLTEEESTPKDAVISQLKFKGLKSMTLNVYTRKQINRSYYQKWSEIKRKAHYDLIPKDSTNEQWAVKHPISIVSSSPAVSYRPGPLCKKQELQVNGCDDWETVVVTLPKVNVKVKPQIGKKMPPVVRPFVKFDCFDISKGRAEFALSALVKMKTSASKKNDELQNFQFPTSYKHNQEKVMMRKNIPKVIKKKRIIIKEKPKPESPQDVLAACEHVMSKILDYVEIKEIGDDLLKYDMDTKLDVDVTPAESSRTPMKESKEGKEKEVKEKRKDNDAVYRELRRLNVRTVNLSNAEGDDSDRKSKSVCTTSCRLGCVCHSISSRYPPSNHCGETFCMINCICGFEARCRDESAEDSKGVLNERTLSRCNKEAKRNITAREERDFTQTAIRSNNKTIILGNSRVSKRTPKYNFKRFEGFHVSFKDDKINSSPEESYAGLLSQKLIQTDRKLNSCVVNLVRCDFDDVVPFCLVHNLYDCYCGGKAVFSPLEHLKKQRMLSNATFDSTMEEILDKYGLKNYTQAINNLNRNANPKEELVTNPLGLSARMRGTGQFFLARNKTNKFKNMMARKLKYDPTVDHEIVNKWVILPLLHMTAKPAKDAIASVFDNKKESVKKRLPDEDEIVHIDDDDSELNRRKRKRKQTFPTSTEIAPPVEHISLPKKHKRKSHTLRQIGVTLTRDGCLYSPTKAISIQFSEMMGRKSMDSTEFRLLLWGSLVNIYENDEINIWINMTINKLRFIVTDSISNPNGGYTNIRSYEKSNPEEIKVDFIKWIVTKKLPETKNSDNILVILMIHPLYWEICGICAKNNQTANNAMTQSQDRLSIDSNENSNSSSVSTKSEPAETIQRVNEKYYKTVEQVVFANGTFAPKKLVLSEEITNYTGIHCLSAALPSIPDDCRWRVLKINSIFAILAFARNEFRIKCSDILTVTKVAMKNNKTIIINNREVAQNYMHKLFGIYVPPNFRDRIFIGPYLEEEDHGLITLRFVNNELVNTDEFNQLRGLKNLSSTGLWYKQRGRARDVKSSLLKQGEPVIDLTEVRSMMKSNDVTITPTATLTMPKLSLMKPQETKRASKQFEPIGPFMMPVIQNMLSDVKVNQLTPDEDMPELIRIHLKDGSPPVSVAIPKKETLIQKPATPKKEPLIQKPASPQKIPPLNDLNKLVSSFTKEELECLEFENFSSIVSKVTSMDAAMLEDVFTVKLKLLMKHLKIPLPAKANPICFRLNFGNGIIVGYTLGSEVVVYWPGDCKKQFSFANLDQAVQWLCQELHEVFICIPSTFKIMVRLIGPAQYFEYMHRGVISQKYFKEICIIGDFGIMRLSEARQYLMCNSRAVAKGILAQAEGRNPKFKKAMTQIIESNDMNNAALQEKVNELVRKATAAADKPKPRAPSSRDANIGPPLLLPITTEQNSPKTSSQTSQISEVICLDSDDDDTSVDPPVLKPQKPTSPVKKIPVKNQKFKRRTLISSKYNNINSQKRPKIDKRMSLPAMPSSPPKKHTKDEKKSKEKKSSDVMQIDLTHMTTEKVKELLKGYEFGDGAIRLTQGQVQRLKSLSRNSLNGA